MSHSGVSHMKQVMVVVSTVHEWSSLASLLQDHCGDKRHQITFSSLGSTQVFDLVVDGTPISLSYADLEEDMTDESISQAMEGCFRSCSDGIKTFLLLIQGGHYTERERRMVEVLQEHFGADVLKYLVILSLEDGQVTEMLDDMLLDLINMCDGRYCQITSPAVSDKLSGLITLANYMLIENGVSGYTENMLADAKNRSTETSAKKMLKKAVEAFKQLIHQRKERRTEEMEGMEVHYAEERQEEAASTKQHEAKRGSLDKAMITHRDMVQLQMCASDDEETKTMSVVLLGLSSSGKSSALKLILERAGNQYPIKESSHDPLHPTLAGERRELFAAGRRLILVDTPELWDVNGVEKLDLVKDCLALSLPGPHVFLLVLQVGRFTQGESEMLGHLQKIFGKDFAEHAIVLFVHLNGNQQRPQRIHDYVAGAHSTLQNLIRKCGSRYYELDVANSQNILSYSQVKDLLTGMNKLVASHGGRCHSMKRFNAQELQNRIKVLEELREGALEVNRLLQDE